MEKTITNIVALLLEKGSAPDIPGHGQRTALSWACAARQTGEDLVNLPLQRNVEVDVRRAEHGITPLPMGAVLGFAGAVRPLLKATMTIS